MLLRLKVGISGSSSPDHHRSHVQCHLRHHLSTTTERLGFVRPSLIFLYLFKVILRQITRNTTFRTLRGILQTDLFLGRRSYSPIGINTSRGHGDRFRMSGEVNPSSGAGPDGWIAFINPRWPYVLCCFPSTI